MLPDERIKHLVVLMMENRSFDHLLGFLKRENPNIRGVLGQDYANRDSSGEPVYVTDGAAYQGQYNSDPGHDFEDVYHQIYGVQFPNPAPAQPNMSGFAADYELAGGEPQDIMRCFVPDQVPILTSLARQYAVCDQWFSSIPGPTLPNRAFAHFGTSFGRLDLSPDYFRAKRSIYQRLAEVGKNGKIYYYAKWSGTMGLTFLLADQPKYFGLWGDFLHDCDQDQLPEYSFIEPPYVDHSTVLAADQHPDHNVRAGDQFIGAVYSALRQSKAWMSTVLLIVWDEHGGIYDHEIPPVATSIDGFESQAPPFKFDRLGVRVPAIVVSPYVAPGTVDHTVYEHASIPATVTAQFIGDPLQKSPFAREQHANRFLGVLSLNEPRKPDEDFGKSTLNSAEKGKEALTAVVQTEAGKSLSGRPISRLLKDHVQEVHAVLRRNHPDLAKAYNPATIKTETDAHTFIQAALDRVHAPGNIAPSLNKNHTQQQPEAK